MTATALASRVLSVGAALGLISTGVFVALALRDGAFSDRCAERLVDDVGARDREAVESQVRAPTVVDALLSAARVELGFVRPESSASARVGLFVRATATSTSADVVVLRLDTSDRSSCVFLRDFEPGPFEP